MEATTSTLRDAMRGVLLERTDAAYDAARRVYNGMIDRRPDAIARCEDVADVIAAVNHARRTGQKLAVRGGGHNAAGLGVCDDGLVVDLTAMHSVRVDPAARTVRVEGGATWAQVDHATHAFGLAVPCGIIASTGVGGLTLGGGHGYLTRKYGLTIDSLVAADVVLADGRLVTATEDQHADLFWALRGGGGNFGAVTSFVFRAHPVDTVFAGPMFWPVEAAEDVLRWYRDFQPRAPRDAYAFYGIQTVPEAEPFPARLHGKAICALVWCHLGSQDAAEATFQEARDALAPDFEHVGPMPLPVLNGLFDPLYPAGLQWYWKGDFFQELDDDAAAIHAEFGAKLPTPLSGMHLYPVDGAVHDVDAGATAFSYRDALWSAVYVGVDPDPGKRDAITTWARDYWEALHPHSMGGAYVNFLMDEGEERVRATYRGNYDRLVAVKREVDPGNLFCVNQNIRPTNNA